MPQSRATARISRASDLEAELAVDHDDRDVNRIAPGDRRRLPVMGFLEPRVDPSGAGIVPAGARGGGDLGEADRGAGHADDADPAVAQFEIGRGAFEHVGGDREDLVAELAAGVVDRRRQGHRAAAGDRAESHRDRGGVGEGEHDIVGRHLPLVGHHLGKDRLHALALRAGARGDVKLATRVEPHGRALERSDPGALDIAADAEAEMPAALPRRRLPLAKGLDPADRRQRFFERARVVAAVVDDRFAVAIEDAGQLCTASRPPGSCCGGASPPAPTQVPARSGRRRAP